MRLFKGDSFAMDADIRPRASGSALIFYSSEAVHSYFKYASKTNDNNTINDNHKSYMPLIWHHDTGGKVQCSSLSSLYLTTNCRLLILQRKGSPRPVLNRSVHADWGGTSERACKRSEPDFRAVLRRGTTNIFLDTRAKTALICWRNCQVFKIVLAFESVWECSSHLCTS